MADVLDARGTTVPQEIEDCGGRVNRVSQDDSADRSVLALHPARRDDIADLVTRRPVPGPGLKRLGAFLFLNHHGPQVYPPNNGGLPFGPHPHRGFETVTFVLDGDLAHHDTTGHESIITKGGVQWMTAGSGLVHSEVSPESFKRSGGGLELLQLWVNLPARLKMSPPCYTGVQKDQIVRVSAPDDRITVNLIAGSWNGSEGPIASLTNVLMTTIDAKSGGRVRFGGLLGRDIFLYVVRGEVSVRGTIIPAFNLAELNDGEAVEIEALSDSLVVFGHADPIDEPVVSQGPFVMNTDAEIAQAYVDFRAGRFDVAV